MDGCCAAWPWSYLPSRIRSGSGLRTAALKGSYNCCCQQVLFPSANGEFVEDPDLMVGCLLATPVGMCGLNWLLAQGPCQVQAARDSAVSQG